MAIPEEYKDLPVVASVSGGKDSTALCLYLQEQGIKYRAVHMDTGWEHPATDEYIREVLEPRIGPIEWISGALHMRDLILKKGMFPGRVRRFCTQHLKVLPFMAWLQDQYGSDVLPVSAVGIRAEESAARSELGEFEDVGWAMTWRPLITWAVDDVVAIHKRHDMSPCNLYFKPGISRVGCWPCIYARKSEIAAVSHLTPWRIDEIRELEQLVFDAAEARARAGGDQPDFGHELSEVISELEGDMSEVDRARAEKKKASLERKIIIRNEGGNALALYGRQPPTYFTLPGHGERQFPIDEAVKWSKTKYGGAQYELFYDPDRSGCLRWGMCDV